MTVHPSSSELQARVRGLLESFIDQLEALGMERSDAVRLLLIQSFVRMPDLDSQLEALETLADILVGDEDPPPPVLRVVE